MQDYLKTFKHSGAASSAAAASTSSKPALRSELAQPLAPHAWPLHYPKLVLSSSFVPPQPRSPAAAKVEEAAAAAVPAPVVAAEPAVQQPAAPPAATTSLKQFLGSFAASAPKVSSAPQPALRPEPAVPVHGDRGSSTNPKQSASQGSSASSLPQPTLPWPHSPEPAAAAVTAAAVPASAPLSTTATLSPSLPLLHGDTALLAQGPGPHAFQPRRAAAPAAAPHPHMPALQLQLLPSLATSASSTASASSTPLPLPFALTGISYFGVMDFVASLPAGRASLENLTVDDVATLALRRPAPTPAHASSAIPIPASSSSSSSSSSLPPSSLTYAERQWEARSPHVGRAQGHVVYDSHTPFLDLLLALEGWVCGHASLGCATSGGGGLSAGAELAEAGAGSEGSSAAARAATLLWLHCFCGCNEATLSLPAGAVSSSSSSSSSSIARPTPTAEQLSSLGICLFYMGEPPTRMWAEPAPESSESSGSPTRAQQHHLHQQQHHHHHQHHQHHHHQPILSSAPPFLPPRLLSLVSASLQAKAATTLLLSRDSAEALQACIITHFDSILAWFKARCSLLQPLAASATSAASASAPPLSHSSSDTVFAWLQGAILATAAASLAARLPPGTPARAASPLPYQLATALLASGHPWQALPYFQEARGSLAALLPPGSPALVAVGGALGVCLQAAGQCSAALPLLEEHYQQLGQGVGGSSSGSRQELALCAQGNLGECLLGVWLGEGGGRLAGARGLALLGEVLAHRRRAVAAAAASTAGEVDAAAAGSAATAALIPALLRCAQAQLAFHSHSEAAAAEQAAASAIVLYQEALNCAMALHASGCPTPPAPPLRARLGMAVQLAALLWQEGRAEEALGLQRAAHGLAAGGREGLLLGGEPGLTARGAALLAAQAARTLGWMEWIEGGEEGRVALLLREALAALRTHLGATHADTLAIAHALGVLCLDCVPGLPPGGGAAAAAAAATPAAAAAASAAPLPEGPLQEGTRLLKEAWLGRRGLLGTRAADTLASGTAYALALQLGGQQDSAAALVVELGVEHVSVPLHIYLSAAAAAAAAAAAGSSSGSGTGTGTGSSTGARSHAQLPTPAFSPTPACLALLNAGRAARLLARGRLSDALPLYQASTLALKATLGSEDAHTTATALGYAQALRASGRKAEAVAVYREAMAQLQVAQGAQGGGGSAVAAAGAPEAAVAGAAAAETAPGAGGPTAAGVQLVKAALECARLLKESGSAGEAVLAYRGCRGSAVFTFGQGHPVVLECLEAEGALLIDMNRCPEATPVLQQAWEARQGVVAALSGSGGGAEAADSAAAAAVVHRSVTPEPPSSREGATPPPEARSITPTEPAPAAALQGLTLLEAQLASMRCLALLLRSLHKEGAGAREPYETALLQAAEPVSKARMLPKDLAQACSSVQRARAERAKA